jgi:adenylate cyclase
MTLGGDGHGKRLVVAGIVSAFVCGIVILAERSVIFRDVEYWAHDFLVNHGGYTPTSSDIVIVDFDEATFARLQQYPISRKAFADVIARVTASGPSIIGLDVLLSEARNPEEDEALRQALSDAGSVIVASQAGAGGIPDVRPLPIFCEPEEAGGASGFCKEGPGQSTGALGYAFVNFPVESDGFVRRFFLFSTGASHGVSFSAMLAQQHAGEALRPLDRSRVSFLGRAIPYADALDRSVWIGAWSPLPARRVSAIELLQSSDTGTHDFRDKLVLVGQSHDAARDLFLTPVFRPEPPAGPRLRLAGIEVHAAAIETLLAGRAVRTVPQAAAWTLLFLLSAVGAWLFLRFSPAAATLGILALSIAIYAAAQVLFMWPHVWMRYAVLMLGTLLSVPVALGYRFVREQLLRSAIAKEREQIMALFGRYVSPEVAEEIWTRRAEIVLVGQERVATVLFSDIRGFTAKTAGHPSAEVLQWLNTYLTAMDEVIRAHGGYLNKFIGDGIMVLFGVPLSDGIEKDAVDAVRAAVAMLDRLRELNRPAEAPSPFGPLQVGIGLHTGMLTCGNVGSSSRLEYSAIGETVNLASRLEGLTKEFNTRIVMSRATADAIRAEFPNVRHLGKAEVRGFADQMDLYTIDVRQP